MKIVLAAMLIVYGGGRGLWLRYFDGLVPGYRNIDVQTYLRRAR